ncbi:MAG TPA: FAD binding domain-containing protein [Actinomycetota bacterium]|jgi:carbon-monoxide dehydrogenase medium subunit
MDSFEYRAPTDLREGLEILAEFGPDAKVLAGGQSLMILLRQRLLAPRVIVSLKRLGALTAIESSDGGLRLGSMVTYRAASASPAVRAHAPILARAASSVGSIHIRNLGTLGGSLCHADPAADVPTVLLALDAMLRAAGSSGRNTYPADQFFTGLFQTRIATEEVLEGIDVPAPAGETTFGYGRFSYREGEYPMAVAACRLTWDGQTCTDARIAVGGGDVYPKRLPEVEGLVRRTGVDAGARAEVRGVLPTILRPMPDIRGSGEWKSRVLAGLMDRVLDEAARRGAPRA